MSLECLEHNFQVLHTFTNSKRAIPELIANWSGTHLYIRGVGFGGRFWSWIYSLASLFNALDFRHDKFISAIKHTNRLFIDFQKKALGDQADYLNALKERSLGREVVEMRLHDARRNLTKWQSATKQWMRFIKTDEAKPILRMLDEVSSSNMPLESFGSAERLLELKSLRQNYKIISLEGFLQQPLQVDLLFKIACAQKLKQVENVNFKKLVKRINKNNLRKITVRHFDKSMRRLMEIFETIESTSFINTANLSNLSMAFILEGCELYLQEDAAHLEWRKSLKPKQELYCNGRKLILGELLKTKKNNQSESDCHLVYTVENDKSIVVSIANNRAVPLLKKEVYEQHGWALESAIYIDIEKSGRFAIVERLTNGIARFPWKSNCSPLIPEDQLLVDGIKVLLEWCIDQEKTPTSFCPENIMFGQMGYLKFTRAHFEGVFEYNTLLKFVEDCANGNRWVNYELLKTIRYHSELVQATFEFYRAVVEQCVGEEKFNLDDLKAIHQIHPHHTDVLQEGTILYNDIKAVKKSSLEMLVEILPSADIKFLEEQVAKSIIYCYEKNNSIAFLPVNFQEQVICVAKEIKGQ